MTAERIEIPAMGFALTPEERMSPLWKKMADYFLTEVDKLRLENDRIENTDHQTLAIRARIRVFNQILAAGSLPGRESVALEPDGSGGGESADWQAV